MILFFSLLLVHLIADFYLQPHSWIMDKVAHKEKSIGLVKHISVHTFLTLIVLIVLEPLSIEIAIALSIIVVSHYAIDVWKTYMGFTLKFFILDQVAHIAVLLGVAILLSEQDLNSITLWLKNTLDYGHLLLAIAYLFSYKPVSLLIQLILRPYTEQFESTAQDQHGLKTAGEYIGGLERLLIVTFVLLDQFAGIGFLLAAKSVFRFGDMRRQQDRKLTEYIMLGTLLSTSFALFIGLLVNSLLV